MRPVRSPIGRREDVLEGPLSAQLAANSRMWGIACSWDGNTLADNGQGKYDFSLCLARRPGRMPAAFVQAQARRTQSVLRQCG
jgi:hypothetical protein